MEGAPARFYTVAALFPDLSLPPRGTLEYVEANMIIGLGRPRFSVQSALEWFTVHDRAHRHERMIARPGDTRRDPHPAEREI